MPTFHLPGVMVQTLRDIDTGQPWPPDDDDVGWWQAVWSGLAAEVDGKPALTVRSRAVLEARQMVEDDPVMAGLLAGFGWEKEG